ncbi:hypothetical protein OUZ56_017148 [Daphnia magna]|uniref:Uncharacterized protein n=1 Tax=Daphnia magna TaxID=35525 RepID=A0ABR0ASF1_9CRUS|nr:hypothetical protein OUZ56_017148 [Daphnia magna]
MEKHSGSSNNTVSRSSLLATSLASADGVPYPRWRGIPPRIIRLSLACFGQRVVIRTRALSFVRRDFRQPPAAMTEAISIPAQLAPTSPAAMGYPAAT